MTKASDNIFPQVILDAVTSAPAAPSNDNWKLYAQANGVFARSSNTIVGPFGTAGGGGTGQGLVDYAFARRTGGDVTCSADAVWADVDTGIDLTITAASGDRVFFGISATCTGTEAVALNLTPMTIVSASPVNDCFSGTTPSDSTSGVPGWRFVGSQAGSISGGFIYALQAGDISGGTATFRLRYRTATSTNRVLRADTTLPLYWQVMNIGGAL